VKIIAIFIPHAGCPYKCIYCDQNKISGTVNLPTTENIKSIIERNLKTIPKEEVKEVAFFGGTFTFLPEKLQEDYLDTTFPYIKKGIIKSIRISTHPEAVSIESMKRFKKKGGLLVELGIQSLDKDVLRNIKREVDFKIVKKAVKYIKDAGLKLGVQIMLGLPGDNLEKSSETAKKLIKLKPETVRIYPTLVLKGTQLATRFKKGKYRPLSLGEAVDQAAALSDIFKEKGVKVIRIGLHPSKDLDSKKIVLAGPYHPSFGEMVRSRKMRNKILSIIDDKYIPNRSHIEIHAPKNMFNLISGHRKSEKKFLENRFNVSILYKESKNNRIKIKDIRKDIALIDPKMPKEAKEKLKRLNYYVLEAFLHKKLQKSIKGHSDMMLFKYGKKVIHEPSLESIADLLRENGYECIKGERITSSKYPKDVIYNACNVSRNIIHYKGKIEKNIKAFKCRYIPVKQGYAKCSIVPVDNRSIITSDIDIKNAWEKNGGIVQLIRPGHIRLPGYNTGFIGGASGVNDKTIFFVGNLDAHPDGSLIRDFIEKRHKNIIELYKGPLYDVGTVMFFPC